MITLIDHKPEHHVRDRLTLLYTPREGDPESLKLPKVARGRDAVTGLARMHQYSLAKGNNVVPTWYFHAMGGNPDIVELIAQGVVKPVCEDHFFDDHQPACRYCGVPNPLY